MTTTLRDDLQQAYNHKAQARDRNPKQAWKLAEQQRFLTLLLQEQKQMLLEIGAGTGIDGKFFQAQGLTVTCIDLSPEMVKLCRQKGLEAQVMDFAHLGFPPESFEAVYALNCLLHLPKAELPAVLATIKHILVQNGLFYMGVYGGPDQEGIYEKDDYAPKRFFSFYSDEKLKETVSTCFTIETFNRIDLDEAESDLHFQSLILRKQR